VIWLVNSMLRHIMASGALINLFLTFKRPSFSE
jgi:hypothetical protein